MPWKETCCMDERMKFVAAWLEGEESRAALCRRFGISRKTGYKWWERYAADPSTGLSDRSHAPLCVPHRLSGKLAVPILEVRHAHPSWGPRKLRAVLMERWPERSWPAASTIGDLLRREGLVNPRRRRRLPLGQSAPFGAIAEANDTWCMDFKGWFRTGDGRRCDPLTVSDAMPTAAICWLAGSCRQRSPASGRLLTVCCTITDCPVPSEATMGCRSAALARVD
jgi:putative transposase